MSTEQKMLRQRLSEHTELRRVFYDDVTVHAWFQMVEAGRCTLEEAYIGIIVHLVREKKHYFDEIIEMKMRHADPPKGKP